MLRELSGMPTEQPQRFRALRRGVDKAAQWMRCDPHFDVLSDLTLALVLVW